MYLLLQRLVLYKLCLTHNFSQEAQLRINLPEKGFPEAFFIYQLFPFRKRLFWNFSPNIFVSI